MDSNDNPLDQIKDELMAMEDTAFDEIVANIADDFLRMESTFAKEIGVTDREPMFFVVRDPDNEPPEQPTAIIDHDGNRTDQQPGIGEALVVEQMDPDGDDTYKMLANLDFEMLANGSTVGLLTRVCGWASAMSADSGDRPSQAEDKQNVIVTMLVTDSSMHMAVRFVDETEETEQVKSESKRLDQFFDKNAAVEDILGELGPINTGKNPQGVTGWGAMADAALAAWMTPRLLKGASPKIFSKLVEERKK
jgi:hypothetical protein